MKILAVCTFLASAAPATAQSCQPYDMAFHWLENLFGEHVVDTVQGDGAFLQFWGNSATGTWTILHVDYDALACLVSSGGGWDGRVSLFGRET